LSIIRESYPPETYLEQRIDRESGYWLREYLLRMQGLMLNSMEAEGDEWISLFLDGFPHLFIYRSNIWIHGRIPEF
jgi:hypothetical protein